MQSLIFSLRIAIAVNHFSQPSVERTSETVACYVEITNDFRNVINMQYT